MFTISDIENIIAEKIRKIKDMAKIHFSKEYVPLFEKQEECVTQDLVSVSDTIDDNRMVDDSRMVDDNGNRTFKVNSFSEIGNMNQHNYYVDENGNRLTKDNFDKYDEIIVKQIVEEKLEIIKDTLKEDGFKTVYNDTSIALLEKFEEIKKMFRG